MATDLELKLGLLSGQFDKGIKKSTGLVDRFGNALTTSSKGGEVFSNTVKNKVEPRMKKVGRGAASANATMVEFSRTISDAPYGMQGVANNLQQLSQNFANLKNSAKDGGISTFALLKKSLLGGGGIVLLISAVTAAWVAYENGVFKVKSAQEKLNDAIKKSAEDLRKYIEGLRGVEKSQLSASKASVGELRKLSLLRTQVENVNNSMALRLDGIKKLRKEFPGYFKNITDEKLLNGQATESYNLLTTAIIKRAKAKAAESLLISNEKKILDLKKLQGTFNDKAFKASISANKSAQLGAERAESSQFYAQQGARAEEERTTALAESTKIQKQLNALTKDNINLVKEVTDNIQVEPDIDTPGSPKATKVTPYAWWYLNPPTDEEIAKALAVDDQSQAKLETKARLLAFKINNQLRLIGEGLDGVEAKFEPLSALDQLLEDLTLQWDETINAAPTDLFAGLAEGIGNAIGDADVSAKAAGAGLLSTIGDIAVKLGTLAIATGVGLTAVGEALKNPFTLGPAAVAAGVALVAIGSAFKAGASNLTKSKSGGSGGSSKKGGYSNTYSSGASATFAGSGQVVFRISGQDLVGVLGRVTAKNQKLGGSVLYGG